MKRSLIVVLTIAILLFAFAGLAVAAEQDDAAARLQGFGVIEGYPDGSMGLERDITRAEFAKIAVMAKGLEEAATLLQSSASQFSDVQTGVWYTGWINVANAQGIVKGDPAGTFRPNDNISNAEAVTMILRVLGYNDNLVGAWPMNYLVKGADLGITSGLLSVANANANRGVVFTMLNRALDEDVMVWGTTTKSDDAEFTSKGFTLLQEMLNAKSEAEGWVTDNFRTDSKLKENEIRIDGSKFTLMSNDDVDWLLGLEVEVKHNKDDEIAYVEVKTSDSDIVFDQISGGVASGFDEVTLKAQDDDFSIHEDAVFVVFNNSEEVRKYTMNSSDEIPVAISEFNYGKFVLEDGDIIFAWVFEFDDTMFSGVVTELDGEFVEYLVLDDAEYDIDLEDYDEVYAFDTKLMAIDIEELDIDSVIYAWENDDDELFLIVVNSAVEGELTGAREDRVTVDGTNVKVTRYFTTISDDENDNVEYYRAAALSEMIENLVDEDVVVLLDAIGYARHIVGNSEGSSGDQYGLVLRSNYAEETIRVFTQDGTTVTYAFDETDEFEAFYNHFGIRGTDENFVPIKYNLNRDGEIKENSLVVVAFGADYDATLIASAPLTVYDLDVISEFDDDDDYILADYANKDNSTNGVDGRFYITNSTVLMKFEDRDEEAVVNWADIKGKTPGTVKAFVLGDPGRNAKFVVFYEDFTNVVDDTLYAVAPNRSEYRAGEWRMVLDVAGEGNQEYILDVNGDIARHELVKFTVDSDGVVKTSGIERKSVTSSVYAGVNSYKILEVDGNSVQLQSYNAAGVAGAIEWYRLDSGVVIWETKDNGDTDRKISRLRENDWIIFVGEGSLIKAALQINKTL